VGKNRKMSFAQNPKMYTLDPYKKMVFFTGVRVYKTALSQKIEFMIYNSFFELHNLLYVILEIVQSSVVELCMLHKNDPKNM
jgi:hypothetical protein